MSIRRPRYIINVKGQTPADLPARVAGLHALAILQRLNLAHPTKYRRPAKSNSESG